MATDGKAIQLTPLRLKKGPQSIVNDLMRKKHSLSNSVLNLIGFEEYIVNETAAAPPNVELESLLERIRFWTSNGLTVYFT